MFDPRSIRKGVKNSPRKIVIYGPPKIGKSSLASVIPGALMIPTEDRVNHINCEKTEIIKSYDELIDIFEYLMSGTTYRTVVIDTIDWLEPMIWDYICRKKGFNSLVEDRNKEVNFGKGLKYHAVEGWRNFLDNCDILREQTGMSIVLVAHSQVEKIDPPDSEGYDRYNLDIDKHAASVVFEWADIVGFYSREIIVSKEDQGFGKKKGKVVDLKDDRRILNLQSTSPAWISGNSYELPDCVVTMQDAPAIMAMILNQEEKPKTKTKKGE
jgi:hypothetical protein